MEEERANSRDIAVLYTHIFYNIFLNLRFLLC